MAVPHLLFANMEDLIEDVLARGVSGRAITEGYIFIFGEGVKEGWNFFKNETLNVQEQAIPMPKVELAG